MTTPISFTHTSLHLALDLDISLNRRLNLLHRNYLTLIKQHIAGALIFGAELRGLIAEKLQNLDDMQSRASECLGEFDRQMMTESAHPFMVAGIAKMVQEKQEEMKREVADVVVLMCVVRRTLKPSARLRFARRRAGGQVGGGGSVGRGRSAGI